MPRQENLDSSDDEGANSNSTISEILLVPECEEGSHSEIIKIIYEAIKICQVKYKCDFLSWNKLNYSAFMITLYCSLFIILNIEQAIIEKGFHCQFFTECKLK